MGKRIASKHVRQRHTVLNRYFAGHRPNILRTHRLLAAPRSSAYRPFVLSPALRADLSHEGRGEARSRPAYCCARD
jgi:hypothetical protein